MDLQNTLSNEKSNILLNVFIRVQDNDRCFEKNYVVAKETFF